MHSPLQFSWMPLWMQISLDSGNALMRKNLWYCSGNSMSTTPEGS